VSARSFTVDEARQTFLKLLRDKAEYWGALPEKTVKERLDGLCFSILAMIDGSSLGLPAMDIVLRPHPEDKPFALENDEDYWEDGMVINNTMLHEEWHK
jgi:hypothetical protein